MQGFAVSHNVRSRGFGALMASAVSAAPRA